MLVSYIEEDLQVIIILRKQQIAEYLLYICHSIQIICHQAHQSGVGHVTTKINIQSEPTGTGYGCPHRCTH